MALKPDTLDYNGARKFIPPVNGTDKGALFERDLLALVEANDFWQDSRRYCGPLPRPGDVAGMLLLRRSFAPILKIRECLRRHVRGVIGREPLFEFVPATENQTLADEANAIQGGVWDEEGEHKIAISAAQRLCGTGRVFVRFDVPPGMVEEITDPETGETVSGVRAESWQEAYAKTYIEIAPRGTAHVYTDPETREKTAFYSYTEEHERGAKTHCVQVSWLDSNKMTQVRILRANGANDAWELDTGGVLLVVEANTNALVTPDLLRLQDIVCSISTMVKINSDVAGFPQLDAIDMAPPVREVSAPTTENPNATRREGVPIQHGPRTVRAWYSEFVTDEKGNPVRDDKGALQMRRGALQYREPVSSEPLRSDIEFFTTEIYSAFNQRHIQARTSANASGEMLVEMRSDYADSLLETKPDLEKLLRLLKKARLCLAAYLAGDNAALETFKAGRVRVDLQLNAGPLSAAERAEVLKRLDAGLLSNETAMLLLGTEDVDAELEKIRAQQQRDAGDGF